MISAAIAMELDTPPALPSVYEDVAPAAAAAATDVAVATAAAAAASADAAAAAATPPAVAASAAAAAAGSGYDSRSAILGDMRLDFTSMFERWISRQGAERILSDATYDQIVLALQKQDTAHAKYARWRSKYGLVQLNPPYLTVKVDAAAQQRARGLSGNKRKQQEANLAPRSTAAAELDGEQQNSSPSIASAAESGLTPQHRPVWIVQRVPRASEIPSIIASAHSSGANGSGHARVVATYKEIERGWSDIPRCLVEAFVKRCRVCAAVEPNKTSAHHIEAIVSRYFGERMQLDLTFFTEVIRGEKQVHIIMNYHCHFTKLSMLRELPNKSAEAVHHVLRQMIADWGPPTILQTDNGGEFKGPLFDALEAQWRYQHVRSAPYSPESQGSVEHSNGTCKMRVATAILETSTGIPFEQRLQLAQWQVNKLWRSGFKMSPYQLVFNRIPGVPVRTSATPAAYVSPGPDSEPGLDAAAAGPAHDQRPTASEEALFLPAEVEDHLAAHAAAAVSASAHAADYQRKFVETHNRGVLAKHDFRVGQLVSAKLRDPLSKKGIRAKVLVASRIPAVIIAVKGRYKFQLYTAHGVITTLVESNDLEPMAEANWPDVLKIDVATVLKGIKNNKKISMKELIQKGNGTAPLARLEGKPDGHSFRLMIRKDVIEID